MKEISEIYSGINKGVELAPYTTWKIGGPATYFWEPDVERLPKVFKYCQNNNIKVYFLGRGSNVLIDSKGLDGLVICTKRTLQHIEVDDEGIITAHSGVPMPKLSNFASKLGYGGYEYLIGIPGSVGAGIAINAGLSAHGRREIGDVLIDVELMDEQGNISTEKADELALSYRSSNIPNRNLFVLSARFKATYKASAEDIREKTVEHLKERRRKQPLSKPTAGSTFKQPYGGKSAGWYIDQAGLKGYSVGGAKISEKHANWIENFDNASCDHVKKLIEIVIAKVEKDFGIILEQEVSLLS